MRRTYHYDEASGQMVEGPAPTRTDRARVREAVYNFKAPDGTLINSRKKHRDYMKRNNLTTIDDYAQEWATAAEKRANFKDPTLKKDIIDAVEKLSSS